MSHRLQKLLDMIHYFVLYLNTFTYNMLTLLKTCSIDHKMGMNIRKAKFNNINENVVLDYGKQES